MGIRDFDLENFNKRVLIELNVGIPISNGDVWTASGVNSYYIPYTGIEICRITENGVNYLRKFNTGAVDSTPGRFFHDWQNNRLYVHTFNSDSPYNSDYTFVGFGFIGVTNQQSETYPAEFIPSTQGDCSPSLKIYYMPVLPTAGTLNMSVAEFYTGSIQSQFGNIKFIDAAYWYYIKNTYIFHNKNIAIKVGELESDYEDFVQIFQGKIQNPQYSDVGLSLNVIDIRYGIFKQIPPDRFDTTTYPNLDIEFENEPVPILLGIKNNILPVQIDITTYKFKISQTIFNGNTYALQSIDAVYKDGVLQNPALYSTDLTNGEFTLNAMPDSSIITCDAHGIKIEWNFTTNVATGVFTENAADFLFFVLYELNNINADIIKLFTFKQLQTKRTQRLGLYLREAVDTIEVVRSIQKSAVFHYLIDNEGYHAVRFYDRGTPPPSPDSIVVDGGFEEWSGGSLVEWNKFESGTSTVNQESVDIYEGTYAVRFDVDGSDSNVRINQEFSIIQNGSYCFDFWYKNSIVGKTARIIIRDSGSNVYLDINGDWQGAATNINLPNVTEYTKKSIYFIGDPNYTEYRIVFTRATATSSSIYFDTVSIIPTDYLRYYRDYDFTSGSLKHRPRTTSIFNEIVIKYDKHPMGDAYSTVFGNDNDVEWEYGEKRVLEIETLLVNQAESQSFVDFYISLQKTPPEELQGEITATGLELIPTDKISVTASLFDEEGEEIIIDDDEIYGILSANKNLDTGKVKIIALADTALTGSGSYSDESHQNTHGDYTDHDDEAHEDFGPIDIDYVNHDDHNDIPYEDNHQDSTYVDHDDFYSDIGPPIPAPSHTDKYANHDDNPYSDYDDEVPYVNHDDHVDEPYIDVPHADGHADHDDYNNAHADEPHTDSEL